MLEVLVPPLSPPCLNLQPTSKAPPLPQDAIPKEALWSNGSQQLQTILRARTIGVKPTEVWQVDMAEVTRLERA